jgi:hypothetical protein
MSEKVVEYILIPVYKIYYIVHHIDVTVAIARKQVTELQICKGLCERVKNAEK